MAKNYMVVNNANVYTWYANNTKLSAMNINGTEVYRAETDAMSLFNANDYYHPNGAYQRASKSGNVITFNVTQQIVKNIWSSSIDLTNYSKLKITVNITTASQESGNNANRKFYVMANSSNAFTGDFSTRTDSVGSGGNSPGTTHYKIYPSPKDANVATGTRTIEVDISNWNGNYKLGLAVLCGPANTFNLRVTNIVLE